MKKFLQTIGVCRKSKNNTPDISAIENVEYNIKVGDVFKINSDDPFEAQGNSVVVLDIKTSKKGIIYIQYKYSLGGTIWSVSLQSFRNMFIDD